MAQILQRHIRSGRSKCVFEFFSGTLQRFDCRPQIPFCHGAPLAGIQEFQSPQTFQINSLPDFSKFFKFPPSVGTVFVRLGKQIGCQRDIRNSLLN